jgi:hypothetical protein
MRSSRFRGPRRSLDLVAIAVGLDAGRHEGVTLRPRFRFLHAPDRKIVQKLRPLARLHDVGTFRRTNSSRPVPCQRSQRSGRPLGRELWAPLFGECVGYESRPSEAIIARKRGTRSGIAVSTPSLIQPLHYARAAQTDRRRAAALVTAPSVPRRP